MILLTSSEFRSHLKKYLDLATRETVKVKNSNGIIFDITPDKEMRFNPSPSNDPWFDDPRNMEELNRRIADLHSGKSKLVPWEEVKAELEL